MDLLLPALLFPALWLVVVWANASRSGWRRLASRYGTRRPPAPGARAFGRQPGRVGAVSVRGALSVWAEADGLRLAMPAYLRPGFSTLHIPWTDLEATGQGTQDAHPVVEFGVGRPRVGTVALPVRVVRDVPQLGAGA